MIKPVVIPNILLDVFYNNEYQFSLNEFSFADLRLQIAKGKIEGYTFKMSPSFWYLFDTEEKIHESVFEILSDGTVSDWFPKYSINEEYDELDVFSETLSAIIKRKTFLIRQNK